MNEFKDVGALLKEYEKADREYNARKVEREDLRDLILETLKENNLKTIKNDYGVFTIKDSYNSFAIDRAKLENMYPRVFEQVKKDRVTKESLQVNTLK